MIELKNLCAGYGKRDIIKDVSLSFQPSELLILIGPNGSGKSTLIKAALGMLPYSGKILYDGDDLRHLRRKQIAQRAAFLSQEHEVAALSAYRLVLHGRYAYQSGAYSDRDREIALRAMKEAGCLEHRERALNELSGGERQAVYLAMCLAQDADTLFMDEPTTYLDIKRQLETAHLARSLAKRGKAVVAVLHDLPLAMRVADRLAIMEGGKLRFIGVPDELLKNGEIDAVFGVTLCRSETEDGPIYYFKEK